MSEAANVTSETILSNHGLSELAGESFLEQFTVAFRFAERPLENSTPGEVNARSPFTIAFLILSFPLTSAEPVIFCGNAAEIWSKSGRVAPRNKTVGARLRSSISRGNSVEPRR